MPVGSYTVMDGAGNAVGTEEFRAAGGPAGRRYFSTVDTRGPEPHREVIDLVSDGASRPVRIRIDTGSHAILLAPGGKASLDVDGDPVQIEWGPDLYLDYLSPAFSAATANRLGSTADIRGRVPRAGDLPAEEGAAATRPPRGGGDRHAGWPVLGSSLALHGALRTGWTRSLWVAGDLEVSYEGLFELAAYEPGQSGPFPR